MVGTVRPSTAGPRLEKPAMASTSPETRQVCVAAVTITFLASFGEVKVLEPGPEFPAENTQIYSSAPGTSKLPSRVAMSMVRSVAW